MILNRPGSQFKFNKFYNDIAVGTGAGFRFDFKFVIARIDVGMKLRDPLLTDGSKWIVRQRPYSLKDHPMILPGSRNWLSILISFARYSMIIRYSKSESCLFSE